MMNAGSMLDISTEGLSKGVYTLVLSSDNNTFFTRKFVK